MYFLRRKSQLIILKVFLIDDHILECDGLCQCKLTTSPLKFGVKKRSIILILIFFDHVANSSVESGQIGLAVGVVVLEQLVGIVETPAALNEIHDDGTAGPCGVLLVMDKDFLPTLDEDLKLLGRLK